MKSIILVISAVLFVALMLTSCRNYYNQVGPDEEIETAGGKQDPEPLQQDQVIEGKHDPDPIRSRPQKAFAADIAGSGSSLEPYRVDLIAGGGGDGGLDVGDVVVWNDADHIYVKYLMLDADWCLTKTALDVAITLEGIPQANGNPRVGRFTWKADLGYVTEYSEAVPLLVEPGTSVVIAAYARVNQVANQSVTESTWGKGRDFPGKNWAMYFNYRVASPETGGGGESPASDDF